MDMVKMTISSTETGASDVTYHEAIPTALAVLRSEYGLSGYPERDMFRRFRQIGVTVTLEIGLRS